MELQICEKAADRSYSSRKTIHLCGEVGKFSPQPNRKSMYRHIQNVYENQYNFYNIGIFLTVLVEV